jgi:ribosomal protein L7/L12
MPLCSRCGQIVEQNAERCSHCGAWQSLSGNEPARSAESLAVEIQALLSRGGKIAAIRLYREQTGAGLAEAKDAVERIGRGLVPLQHRTVAGDQTEQVLELLRAGKKIAAIKLHRAQTGASLKDAKDAVETLAAEHGIASLPRSGCLAVFALIALGASLAIFAA